MVSNVTRQRMTDNNKDQIQTASHQVLTKIIQLTLMVVIYTIHSHNGKETLQMTRTYTQPLPLFTSQASRTVLCILTSFILNVFRAVDPITRFLLVSITHIFAPTTYNLLLNANVRKRELSGTSFGLNHEHAPPI